MIYILTVLFFSIAVISVASAIVLLVKKKRGAALAASSLSTLAVILMIVFGNMQEEEKMIAKNAPTSSNVNDVKLPESNTEGAVVDDYEKAIQDITDDESSPTAKYDDVVNLARNQYQPTDVEIKQFALDIVLSYNSDEYMSMIDDESYTLTNIFKSNIVMKEYGEDTLGAEFAHDYEQILKYIYRGVESKDSEFIQENQRQLEEVMTKIEKEMY